jgi:hypothetical protein
MSNEINVNQDVVLLPSATRNATNYSTDQNNLYWRGLWAFVNVTQASGTGGLQFYIEGKDPVSGNYVQMSAELLSSPITATGIYCMLFYPLQSAQGGNGSSVSTLSRTWRLFVQHGDSSNYTYSIGCSMLK